MDKEKINEEKKQNGIGIKVILAFSMVVILVMGTLFAAMYGESHVVEKSTTKLSATIDSDAFLDPLGLVIPTKEYLPDLLLSPAAEDEKSSDILSKLQSGQKIYFRIRNRDVDSLDLKIPEGQKGGWFVTTIISVSTETEELFTISDYNRLMQKTVFPGMLVSGTLVLLGLVGMVYSIMKLRMRRR